MLFVPLVFLGKDLFEPVGLAVSGRFIHERRGMIDDEVVAACVAPQDPHCLKISSRLISRLVPLYSHCFHVVNVSESCRLSLGFGSACEPSFTFPKGKRAYLNLATVMSRVQITPTRTNAVNPIRIHCSVGRCFKFISVLAPDQAHPGPVYRRSWSAFLGPRYHGVALSMIRNKF